MLWIYPPDRKKLLATRPRGEGITSGWLSESAAGGAKAHLEGAEDAPARVITVDDVRTGVLVELAKSTTKSVHVPQHLNERTQSAAPKHTAIKYRLVRAQSEAGWLNRWQATK